MALSEEARERLADVVALQPTKNGELEARWGMDSGSDVHQYLEGELKAFYYRDENSLIRATADAADLVGADTESDGPRTVRVPELQAQVFDVVADAYDRAESVVSVLHKLRDTHDIDPAAEEVRSALRGLVRRGVVEVVRKTVPTFRLAVERDGVVVEPLDG
jgi:chromosome condensin MukBEF MukE localization factor